MPVLALQMIRKMRGGSQAHLVLGADDRLWVVKFLNNPQGQRILVNEMIATRIAAAIGLTVPETDAVEVEDFLIRHSPGAYIDQGGRSVAYAPGVHFGSLYVGGSMPERVVDYLPEEQLAGVRNRPEFAGMLCVDIAANNADARQAVFSKTPHERRYKATFIDQGHCFCGNEWRFSADKSRGIYPRESVYQNVTGLESFEPWLSRLEALEWDVLAKIVNDIPSEWYGGQSGLLWQLVDQLCVRRTKVRDLISEFRDSNRQIFPEWKAASTSLPSWREVAESLKPDQRTSSVDALALRPDFAA